MGQKVQGSSFSSTARDAPKLAALQGLVAASSGAGQAPEFVVLQQQALTLQSLLHCSSKQAPEPEILRSLLLCNSKQAPELLKKLWRSSEACCVVAARKLAPEPEILRSLLCCSSKQAPEAPELAAFQ